MKTIKLSAVLVMFVLFAAALRAAKTLDIYVVDVDGGKSMLVVTPSGQSMVVDAGYAGFINDQWQVIERNDVDADRIIKLVKLAKLTQIDYLVLTHYHNDHSEDVPNFVAKVGIPVRTFVDHGPMVEEGRYTQNVFEPYLASIGKSAHVIVKPGDTIPLKGVEVQVLSAGGGTIANPLGGAGAPNDLCGTAPARPDTGENAASVGLLYTFGKFRMVDLADLTKGKEYELMCPVNKVGRADLFMASHHGLDASNSALLVHALRPRVAIVNNGAKKGNAVPVVKVFRSSPGLEDVWQMHYSVDNGKENNTAPDLIANPGEQPDKRSFGSVEGDQGNYIKVSAQEDGTFTVTNSRNGVSKTYKHRD